MLSIGASLDMMLLHQGLSQFGSNIDMAFANRKNIFTSQPVKAEFFEG